MDDFLLAWQHFHPAARPINNLVRDDENSRWLRFHSLPESERYADADAEKAMILSRQLVLAAETIGEGVACWLISWIYVPDPTEDEQSDDVDPWRGNHLRLARDWGLKPVWRIDVPEDECRYDIYVALVTWQSSVFDVLLRSIADDEVRAMWMSAETGSIFAPYDGGTDLILPDTADIVRLSAEHSDWLSSYPGGW